ncbi:glycosyltransferase family 2 protein [Paenibacillus mesophilus]|uniref:glycosyltransferase family 2 protein n=1 Tax=Paenibacillus mesophilus TaxID=2582849 RepID=UPI00110D9049|nr:glycosyltransferase family 2 protein [Paenibacillus mesophilus]TMV50603.1 glycosyltransferase family 2 protein [Paenibacillus mesophilus]
MDCKLIIGMPVYNEEAALPKLFVRLEQLRRQFGEALYLCFVNDGSTDGTDALLRDYVRKHPNAAVLVHPDNRGLGEAMRTMLSHTVRHFGEDDILITLDADNTHSPELIPAMARKLRDEQLDLVIASRFAPGGVERGVPLLRRLYSRGARLFFKLLFPIPGVNDYSSGFRAYSVRILQKAFQRYGDNVVTSKGFACTAEIIARLGKIGVKAGEVPLRLDYDLKEGRSKMNVSRTIGGYFRLIRAINYPSARTEPDLPALIERNGEGGA